MKKNLKKKLKKDLELALFASLLLLLIIYGMYKPSFIGYVTYEITEYEKEWDFTTNEYTYDDSLINLSNGVRLIPNIEIIRVEDYSYENYYVTKALYDPKDKTNKVNALDGEKHDVDKNKIFDVIFEEKLDNGDIIYLYMNSSDADEIFLCDLGTECNSPGYGNINYEGNEGWYNITISNLNEPVIGFNIDPANKIKFNYIYASNGNNIDIVKALYDPSDKTNKVNALDSDKHGVDKNKIFNVIFDNELNNNDIISIYAKLKDNDFSEIYLCDYGIECNSPGYGKVDVNGEIDEYYWFNITISDLDEPTDKFNIDPDIEVYYIYAYRFFNDSYNILNITYPSSAVIDTQDFTINNFGRWDLLEKDEILNNQEIDYYYSTDGITWNLITDFNLSYVDSNTIRLRANLTGTTSTPILISLYLKYLTSTICNEDWHCASWEPEVCPRNETQNRICLDLNECESEDNKPNITGSCSFNCVENWIMYISECRVDNTKLVYYTDEESCGTINNLPLNNGSILDCDYCIPNFVCVSYDSCNVNLKQKECNEVADTNYCYDLTGLDSDNIIPDLDLECIEFVSNLTGSIDDNIMDYNFYYNTNDTLNINLNNSDLFIDLEINNIINGSISIVNYDENIVDKTVNTGLKYFEINASDNIKNNLNSNTIKIYYTDEEINNKNLDEDTLKIYYYNNDEWQELNSTLNKTGKYLEIILDHLSYYGIFGEEKQTSSPSSSGSSGGYILTPKQKEGIIKKEEKTYEIYSSIENEIDFVDSNKYRFNIKNKGDKIDRVELSINNKLVRLSGYAIENFDENQEIDLLLITDPILTRNRPDLLFQGLATKTIEQRIKDVLTEFTILGTVNNEIVANETIQLKLKLLVFDKITNKKTLPYNIIFIIALISLKVSLLLILFNKEKSKRKREKKNIKRNK